MLFQIPTPSPKRQLGGAVFAAAAASYFFNLEAGNLEGTKGVAALAARANTLCHINTYIANLRPLLFK